MKCIIVFTLSLNTFLLGWGAYQHSPNWDEVGHLPSGLSHLEFGNFDLYAVNPPLVRTVAALPVYCVSHETNWELSIVGPGARNEFSVGRKFLTANGFRSFELFTIARWACIPFSWLGAWICFLWGSKLYCKKSGLVALVIWCFSPAVLAYGQMITPEVAAAALGYVANFLFWRWLKQPSWSSAWIAGVALGVTLLSKTTWIILFGLWPVVWAAYVSQSGRRIRSIISARKQLLQMATTFALSVYVINVGYLFEKTLQPLGEFEFVSNTLTGIDPTASGGRLIADNRFRKTFLENFAVPFPANFVKGIDLQKRDFELRMWSYLRGEWRQGGWWYYYLYAMLVKMPIGTELLIAMAVVLPFVSQSASRWKDELVLLAPSFCIIAFVSSQTGLNHHLRYVFPAFPGLYIFASKLFSHRNTPPFLQKAAGIALVGMICSSLFAWPHSRSYFNEAIGGPTQGHYHLGGSYMDTNVDCGQDLLYLRRWISEHPSMDPVFVCFMGVVDPQLAFADFEPEGTRVLRFVSTEDKALSIRPPGTYVISVNHLHSLDGKLESFRQLEPDYRIGYSLHVYHLEVIPGSPSPVE